MPNTGSAMVTTLVPVAARETSAETRRILADAGAPFCGVFLALADGIAAVARSATARPVTTALFVVIFSPVIPVKLCFRAPPHFLQFYFLQGLVDVSGDLEGQFFGWKKVKAVNSTERLSFPTTQ